MALYWPDKKVALDIVDDPQRQPFEGDDSYTVLRVTYADLTNYESFLKIERRLCELLDHEMPTSEDWAQAHHQLHDLLMDAMADDVFPPDDDDPYIDPNYCPPEHMEEIELLAASEEQGEIMQMVMEAEGQRVRGVSVWDGPVPPGSFMDVSDTMRMSTPEYFFLRKANQLPLAEAVCVGMELCGKYRTSLTQFSKEEGYDFLRHPRTSHDTIRRYLQEIRHTKEGKRAKRVLRYVTDDCSSPMSCYLSLLLGLPTSQGGYGFDDGMPSAAFQYEHGFMPGSSGPYMVYDLCWPKQSVAVQYTGSKPPSAKALKALGENGMHVVCVTNEDVADPQRFDSIARRVAGLLGVEAPKPTDKWLKARKRLRRQVPVPTFDHMRLILADMESHYWNE